MEPSVYRHSSSLPAHRSDVRALHSSGTVLASSSRDGIAKFYIDTRRDGSFLESGTLYGHESYVSAITILRKSSHSHFMVVTGSHDTNINSYRPEDATPFMTSKVHSGPVVALSPSWETDCVLSASWDGTAKHVNVGGARGDQALTTYFGHIGAVWCVIHTPSDRVITGGADHNIMSHTWSGRSLLTFRGHSDCVRDLIYLGQDIFMSCSNDGTIKQWHLESGQCIESVLVHTDYIYSFATNEDNSIFAFGGENHILSIWSSEHGINQRQNIYVPGLTVWAVSILHNGDIVCGTSEGFLHFFTKCKDRYSSEKQYDTFVKDVINARLKSTPEEKLPGIDALSQQKGSYDGDTLILQFRGNKRGYRWNGKEAQWEPVVFDETKEKCTQPKMYQGVVYDFVFTVAYRGIKYKLPYNVNQDPNIVAEKFINENNLDRSFLPKVLEFLNTRAVGSIPKERRTSAEAASTSRGLAETPFSTIDDGASSSRAALESSTPIETADIVYEPPVYYPPKSYVYFDTHDLDKIATKVEQQLQERGLCQEDINKVILSLTKLKSDVPFDQEDINVLFHYIETSEKDMLFPYLDVLRLLCRNEVKLFRLCNDENRERFLLILDLIISQKSSAINNMFYFRILSNLFTNVCGENLLFSIKEDLIPKLHSLLDQNSSRPFQIAAATFGINLSLCALTRKDTRAMKLCGNFLDNISNFMSFPESVFRFFVAVGTVSILEGQSAVTDNIRRLMTAISNWDRNDSLNMKAITCAENIKEDLGIFPDPPKK